MTPQEFCQTLESTLLVPTARENHFERLCREAIEGEFLGVCVSPSRAALAVRAVAGSPVKVVSVAGFPLGTQTTRAKVAEVSDLFETGVHEVDLVMNVGVFLDGRIASVSGEIREARRAAGSGVLKVILETCYLTPAQIREAASLALGSGADFLKTSTGFGPEGARIADVRILRQVAGKRCGVKAAGGIRSFDQAQSLLAAGADRLGTSTAAKLAAEAQKALQEPED